MPIENATVGAIRGLLSEKLLVEVDSLDADLLKAGILDSLALIQLLVHLEERFGVKIPLDELDIEDLRSISSIARLVENQRAAQGASSSVKAAGSAVTVNH
jgi:D-alanine--poly(phosphoribitol) ligase subunit 2